MSVPPFPRGPFRFFALDVETANGQRGSICQIGVACVAPDNAVTTWATHVDPQTGDWSCSWVHGITAQDVRGAPVFAQVMPVLARALAGRLVYQHSGFDQRAMAAACALAGLEAPDWQWSNSVIVARKAWPELKGKGGHGLASLKSHLGLQFRHHDAGEDARAAAEVVLHAERAALAASAG
ncbi:MAG: exonuclease [Rhodobacteraceae bacterium]|nr:exonuclease [Paracoccaceae bacterium]